MGYRLAPENIFLVATDDCWRVLKYVHSNAEELGIDPKRRIVSGDSAGGDMAAVCSRRDRNMRTNMLCGQMLIYPVLSMTE